MIHISGLKNPHSKAIYENFKHIVKKTTKIINYISIKFVCPLFMIPILIVNLYAYIFTDLGSDTSRLPQLKSLKTHSMTKCW